MYWFNFYTAKMYSLVPQIATPTYLIFVPITRLKILCKKKNTRALIE